MPPCICDSENLYTGDNETISNLMDSNAIQYDSADESRTCFLCAVRHCVEIIIDIANHCFLYQLHVRRLWVVALYVSILG